MLKVYSYNWATGEYIGSDIADPNPLEPGNYLLPAYSTDKEPPAVEKGKRAVFDFEKQEWLVEDQPAPPPEPFDESFLKVPMNSLLGDTTIGDLFSGQ
jgi:hypothetical protein